MLEPRGDESQLERLGRGGPVERRRTTVVLFVSQVNELTPARSLSGLRWRPTGSRR